MKTIRIPLLLVALLTLGLQGVPHAALPTTCGGSWVSTGALCEFSYNGAPLKVYATADIAGQPVTAVEITLEVKSDPTCGAEWCVPVLGCVEAHTTGFKGCEQSFDNTLPLPAGTVLQCRVRGLTNGDYKCSSGPQP